MALTLKMAEKQSSLYIQAEVGAALNTHTPTISMEGAYTNNTLL